MTFLLLGLTLAAAVSSPQSGTVSLQTYRAQIHSARLALDRAVRAPGDAADVTRAARLLRRSARVRISGAGTVSTDSAARAADLFPLRADTTRDVSRWAESLDNALQRTQVAPVSRSRLHLLDVLLRDPRFHPVQAPWDRLGEWLTSLYRRALRLLNRALQPGSPSSLVSALILLALVATVGALVARGAMRRLVVERSPREEDLHLPATPESAERRAAECAAAGDFRAAVRYLFLATLLQLQARGLLELRPGTTNREYVQRYLAAKTSDPALEQPLQLLVDTFDAVWYGHQAIDELGYARARDIARRALAAVPEKAA